MKKLIFFLLLLIFVIPTSAQNFVTIYNPFTGQLDYYVEVSGQPLNVSSLNASQIFIIGNITALGNISANFYHGDGSLLTGIITSIRNSTAFNRTVVNNVNLVVLANVNDLLTIGNTSTTEKFNVAGNSSLEGNIYAGGNIIGPTGTGARVVDIGWVDDGDLVRLADDADEVLIRTKLDIGNPGNAGGLDVGEGGSYTTDKSGTTIVQAFTYDASAASGSRFTELTLDVSNTLLAGQGDRLYIGSTLKFWAVRFNPTTAKSDEEVQLSYYGNLTGNLTNMSHMVILKDSAVSVGEDILEQTSEKEYTTWDHEINDDWNTSDNIVDTIPDGDSQMYWVAFEVLPDAWGTAPVVDEIKVRGTDFDIVSGNSYPVFWGNARIENHERISLSVVKSPGGTATTNIDIDSAHAQTVFNFASSGANLAFLWTLPEGLDTSSKIHVELDWSANAADTYNIDLSISRLKNNTLIGNTIAPDFTQSTALVADAANTVYTGYLIGDEISIQNMTASDEISFEIQRTDMSNAMYPFSVIIHYISFSTGELVTAD